MKNTIKVLGIIAIVAVIGFSFAACEGPAGPMGPAGQDGKDGIDGQNGKDGINGQDGQQGADGLQGPQGPDGSFKVVDSTGKEIGKYISTGTAADTQAVIATNDFTFMISLSTGSIVTTTLYASEAGGSGSIYVSSLSAAYPNYIRKNKGEFFIAKNRDENGYPASITETLTPASQRTNTGDWAAYTTAQSNVVEVEKISEAADESYFIGTITPPLRIVVW